MNTELLSTTKVWRFHLPKADGEGLDDNSVLELFKDDIISQHQRTDIIGSYVDNDMLVYIIKTDSY